MNRRAVVFCLLLSGCGGDKAGTVASDGAASPAQDGRGSETTTTPQEPRGQRTLTADERRAAGPVLRHFRAIRNGRADAACAEFSRAGRRRFVRDLQLLGEGATCAEVILQTRVPRLSVTSVMLRGDRGTVVLAGDLEYHVQKVDGKWKIAG